MIDNVRNDTFSTEDSSIDTSHIKVEPETELVPLFDTCKEHLKEIHDLQNDTNQSQNHVHAVRRLSANIVASFAAIPLDENRGADENSDSSSDSDACIITGVIGSVLLPLRSTTDELIKRENDLVSGDISYMETVSSIS